jgi:hypothetical protein
MAIWWDILEYGGGYKACEAVDTCVQKLLQQLLLMVTRPLLLLIMVTVKQ